MDHVDHVNQKLKQQHNLKHQDEFKQVNMIM